MKSNELEKNGRCFEITGMFHGNRGSGCVKMYGKLSYTKLQEKIKALEKDAVEYRQVENILRENGEKYKELADLLPQTLFEIDLTGNLSFSNRNSPQSFGYAQGVFDKGLNAMDLSEVDPKLILQEDLHGCERQNFRGLGYVRTRSGIRRYGLKPFRPWRIFPGEYNMVFWRRKDFGV